MKCVNNLVEVEIDQLNGQPEIFLQKMRQNVLVPWFKNNYFSPLLLILGVKRSARYWRDFHICV